PLFTENYQLVVNKNHPLATRDKIDFNDLRTEQLLSRNYCEHGARVNSSLREHGLDVDRSHEIASERDLIELLEADIGVAVVPDTASIPPTLTQAALCGGNSRKPRLNYTDPKR